MNTKVRIFLAIVIAHWVEHLSQAYQMYALGWPAHMAGGMLGYVFPWLVHSELLHFSYALLMMIGLVLLRGEFSMPNASQWWTLTTVIQGWHLVEHSLLQFQALTHPFFDRAVPTSIVQLWFPRVELHLFYNTVVTIPMAVAMYLQCRKASRVMSIQRSQATSL